MGRLFNRPYGTDAVFGAPSSPAMNRWAIIKRPAGSKSSCFPAYRCREAWETKCARHHAASSLRRLRRKLIRFTAGNRINARTISVHFVFLFSDCEWPSRNDTLAHPLCTLRMLGCSRSLILKLITPILGPAAPSNGFRTRPFRQARSCWKRRR